MFTPKELELLRRLVGDYQDTWSPSPVGARVLAEKLDLLLLTGRVAVCWEGSRKVVGKITGITEPLSGGSRLIVKVLSEDREITIPRSDVVELL